MPKVKCKSGERGVPDKSADETCDDLHPLRIAIPETEQASVSQEVNELRAHELELQSRPFSRAYLESWRSHSIPRGILQHLEPPCQSVINELFPTKEDDDLLQSAKTFVPANGDPHRYKLFRGPDFIDYGFSQHKLTGLIPQYSREREDSEAPTFVHLSHPVKKHVNDYVDFADSNNFNVTCPQYASSTESHFATNNNHCFCSPCRSNGDFCCRTQKEQVIPLISNMKLNKDSDRDNKDDGDDDNVADDDDDDHGSLHVFSFGFSM